MRKALLTLTLVIISLTSIAQGLYYHPDFYFDKMSPDGKWLSAQGEGTVYIYDRTNNTYLEYISSEDAVSEFYATGMGNCWSSTGILVGSVNDRDCAYWQDNEWNELPIKAENVTTNKANGITPDGSRIVGCVGLAYMDINSELMVKPVYWDRASDGSYKEYKELPFPATDFCGRTPQYVTALSISDDGKTVVGQIVDWSGWYIYPIIYTEDSNGEWSYRTINEGVLYPKGTEFGTWPGEEPNKPNGELYMNDEELAAYRKDYNAYMDAYNKYLNGEIYWEEVPAEPDPANYITTRKDEYNAAMAEYNRALQAYYYALQEFDNIMMDAMYGYSFQFNNTYISGNGKYLYTTLKHTDTSDPFNPIVRYTPTRIDMSDNDALLSINGNGDMLASSVMNDGRMIVQTPVYAYGRNSFIVSSDGNTITTFVDYLKTVNSFVANWVEEMSTFDVLYAESYDDFGNPILAVAEDSIVAGSVFCDSEGKIFTSFMYDEWSESVGSNIVRQFSYQIDFTEDTGVEDIETNMSSKVVYVADNMLYTAQGVNNVTIYNMQGCTVKHIATPNNSTTLDLAPGIYIVSASHNGRTVKNKIVIG